MATTDEEPGGLEGGAGLGWPKWRRLGLQVGMRGFGLADWGVGRGDVASIWSAIDERNSRRLGLGLDTTNRFVWSI